MSEQTETTPVAQTPAPAPVKKSKPGFALGLPSLILGFLGSIASMEAILVPIFTELEKAAFENKYSSSYDEVIVDTSIADLIGNIFGVLAPICAYFALALGIGAIIWCAASKKPNKSKIGLVFGILGIFFALVAILFADVLAPIILQVL